MELPLSLNATLSPLFKRAAYASLPRKVSFAGEAGAVL
jgi:hypothetical protein